LEVRLPLVGGDQRSLLEELQGGALRPGTILRTLGDTVIFMIPNPDPDPNPNLNLNPDFEVKAQPGSCSKVILDPVSKHITEQLEKTWDNPELEVGVAPISEEDALKSKALALKKQKEAELQSTRYMASQRKKNRLAVSKSKSPRLGVTFKDEGEPLRPRPASVAGKRPADFNGGRDAVPMIKTVAKRPKKRPAGYRPGRSKTIGF